MFMPATPDEIKRIDDKLLNHLVSNLPKCVLAKSDAAYEDAKKKIIEEAKTMDIEKSVTYWMKVYADAKAQYDPNK